MNDKINESNKYKFNDYPVDKEYSVELGELKENEKISILSNAMFMTMFQNEARLVYSALFFSYFLEGVTFDEILKNLALVKNELDKTVENKKGLRSDYVGLINGVKLNLEINNNSSLKMMERNIEYAFRLYASKVNRNTDYKYTQVIQINLNNFSFKGNDKVIDVYTLRNEDGISLTNKITIVQIYIPNLRKK